MLIAVNYVPNPGQNDIPLPFAEVKNHSRFLLLLGMILFLTACATKTKVQEGGAANLQAKWAMAVSKVIKDFERAEKWIALAVQYEERTRALFSELKNIDREIMDINRNYDSTREDYDRALGKFTERKDQALRQYLEALFALREQTTPEEWKALLR